MLTVAWVNYTNCDKRGPNKRFVEYLVCLNKIANKEDIRFVGIFPLITKDSNIIQTFEENNVTYYLCSMSSYSKLFNPNDETRRYAFKNFINNIEQMKSILREINCNIVVSNCTLVWEAAFAAKVINIKHVLFIRGILNPADFIPDQFNFPMIRYMEKMLVDFSDLIVTQSEFTAKLWGLDSFKHHARAIIPIACDVKGVWDPPDIHAKPIKILILSGIESYKNQSLTTSIAYKLKQRGYSFVFSIYGNHKDAEYKKLIEQEIIRLDLKDNISIHDYETDIDKLFLEHHILFITSKLETFGATVIEAMARCRPVISTKSGGPEEIIVNGQTGILAEAARIDDLVDAFRDMLDHPDKLINMGINGHKRWEEKYKMESVMNEWIKVLLKEGNKVSLGSEPIDISEILIDAEGKFKITASEKSINHVKKWLIVAKNPQAASITVGLLNTLEQLQKDNILHYKAVGYEKTKELIGWADCIIFSRIMDIQMMPLLDESIKLGKTTFYYVDDNLYNIPEYSRASGSYNSKEAQAVLKYFIQKTSKTVTCSEWLSKSYEEQYHCKNTWIQPSVKLSNISKVNADKDKVVIGFAGNIDYIVLLERLKDVFLDLYKNYKSKIQFEFFGPKVSFLDEIEAIYYAPIEYSYYEMFLARKGWDIGLAYLEDTSFNNSKYFNKYLEYSRFSIAGIYSDIALYNRIIKNGVNGIVAKNTHEDWYEKIAQLIQDSSLRKAIAKNAYNDVVQNFSPQKGAESFKEKLREYI